MAKPKSIITEYRSYYLSPHFPVLLLSGEHWKISDIPNTHLHFHNCLEIGIVHSGSGTLKFYEQSLSFKAGDITMIPRNVSHTTYSDPGTLSHWSYLFLDPKALFSHFFYSTWPNYDLSMYHSKDYKYILHQKDHPTIHYLLTHIIQELLDQKNGYHLSAQGMLLSVYMEACRVQSAQTASIKEVTNYKTPDNALVLAPALDYIEENYMRSIQMNQLSDLCHWSPTHFRRIFNEIIGTSPLDFVNNTRIVKACNLLRTTQESILNISEMVGFHSVSSFNRYFVRIMDMSPRDYRKQSLSSDITSKHPAILEYAGWTVPEK